MMKIRTAILGYGRSGSTMHAGPVEALDDFEMVAVCDIDPAARQKAEERFSCPVYADYHAMLKEQELDFVIVVTRSDQHCDMVCDCLKAGVNVLVTKPWGVSATEGQRMVDAARDSGKLLMPWLPSRWGSDLRRIKELIDAGTIGRVFQIFRREFSFAKRFDWQTLKQYGGGYLLNWGPHLIDPPLHLIDSPVKTVFGYMNRVVNPGDVEDVFMAIITLENGVAVTSEYGPSAEEYFNWVIRGDKGTIVLKETELIIYKASFSEDVDPGSYGQRAVIEKSVDQVDGRHRITMGNRYGDAMVIYPEIAAALRGEWVYPVTPESALELSWVLDAVRESAQTGNCVVMS